MFAVRFSMHTSFTILNDILLRSFAIVNDCISSYTTRRKPIVIRSHVIRRTTVGYVPFVERLHQYTVVYGFRNPRPRRQRGPHKCAVPFSSVPIKWLRRKAYPEMWCQNAQSRVKRVVATRVTCLIRLPLKGTFCLRSTAAILSYLGKYFKITDVLYPSTWNSTEIILIKCVTCKILERFTMYFLHYRDQVLADLYMH